MKKVPFSVFRANCHALVRQAYKTGEHILVIRKGEVLAEFRPCFPVSEERKPAEKGKRLSKKPA